MSSILTEMEHSAVVANIVDGGGSLFNILVRESVTGKKIKAMQLQERIEELQLKNRLNQEYHLSLIANSLNQEREVIDNRRQVLSGTPSRASLSSWRQGQLLLLKKENLI